MGRLFSPSSPLTAAASQQQQQHYCFQQQRSFARGEGGSRGARGHGWYVKYRSGRGGRHLQGEYVDRESPEQMAAWNESILALGSQRVYMDITMEPRRTTTTSFSKKFIEVPSIHTLTGQTMRLEMDVATTVMPETAQNFLDLIQAPVGQGYKGTCLYRVEKQVGIYGGDMLTNTGKVGRASKGNPMQMDIEKDPLAMWHIPGVITMLVQNVGQIDSRFLFVGHAAPHVDGIARAFGRLTPESAKFVTQWVDTLLTRVGIPTAFDLVVADCGLLEGSAAVDSTTVPSPSEDGSSENNTKAEEKVAVSASP